MHVEIIENLSQIYALVPKCRALAHSSGSQLPYHQLELPLLWWQHFGSDGGLDFGHRRGRNFWGSQSWIEKFQLLIAREDENLLGVVPLVSTRVKLPGVPEQIYMLAMAGDSVLIAYQDFLISPEVRHQVVSLFLSEITKLTRENHHVVFLGYFPEDSANIPLIHQELTRLVDNGWCGGKVSNKRRGGVQPWNLAAIVANCKKLLEMISHCSSGTQLSQLIARLEVINPAMLFFAKTRLTLEDQINEILSQVPQESIAREIKATISRLLAPEKISYPRIQLTGDRETYLTRLSKDTRRYFRRYRTRFLEQGGSFEKISSTEITPKDIDDYLTLHTLRWQNESAAINDLSLDFHREMGLRMAKNGNFCLFFARYNGKRIAAHSCFDIGTRREGYLTGRDPALEELRASRLLYLETILDAIDSGFSCYDLGYGGDDYKLSFASSVLHLHNFVLAPAGKLPNLEKLFPRYEYIVLD